MAKASDTIKTPKPALLAGGNPQIAKGEGDAPVQAYIAAMPGWKSEVGRQLDTLIVRTVPGVHKAVKWNSPFYGLEGQDWFLSFHCFNKYIKVAFFRGLSLRPVPPVESKSQDTATSISMRAKHSTKPSSPRGSSRPANCPSKRCERNKEKRTNTMPKTTATKTAATKPKAASTESSVSASQLIDEKIAGLNDWRGETLAKVRAIVKQAVPGVVEEWKWSVPVWSHGGIICTGETYKKAVKLTFAKGASVEDPSGLFNASLEGNTRRAIDIHEGDKIDEKALKVLVRAAASLNKKA